MDGDDQFAERSWRIGSCATRARCRDCCVRAWTMARATHGRRTDAGVTRCRTPCFKKSRCRAPPRERAVDRVGGARAAYARGEAARAADGVVRKTVFECRRKGLRIDDRKSDAARRSLAAKSFTELEIVVQRFPKKIISTCYPWRLARDSRRGLDDVAKNKTAAGSAGSMAADCN